MQPSAPPPQPPNPPSQPATRPAGPPNAPGAPGAASQPAAPPAQGITSKISFNKPNIGPGAPSIAGTPAAPRDVPMPASAGDSAAGMHVGAPASTAPAAPAAPKITMFGREKRHEEAWSRTPNTTGSGAIHCKTFHCKLTEDALQYMDQAINEWLDAHPQYEVKFVSSTIGTMTGKLKEPALICQVWV